MYEQCWHTCMLWFFISAIVVTIQNKLLATDYLVMCRLYRFSPKSPDLLAKSLGLPQLHQTCFILAGWTKRLWWARGRALPRRLCPAGSSLGAGFLWRNTAPLSLSDHWGSAAGPCPEHSEPCTDTHSQYTLNEHPHFPDLSVRRLAFWVFLLACLSKSQLV